MAKLRVAIKDKYEQRMLGLWVWNEDFKRFKELAQKLGVKHRYLFREMLKAFEEKINKEEKDDSKN